MYCFYVNHEIEMGLFQLCGSHHSLDFIALVIWFLLVRGLKTRGRSSRNTDLIFHAFIIV